MPEVKIDSLAGTVWPDWRTNLVSSVGRQYAHGKSAASTCFDAPVDHPFPGSGILSRG